MPNVPNQFTFNPFTGTFDITVPIPIGVVDAAPLGTSPQVSFFNDSQTITGDFRMTYQDIAGPGKQLFLGNSVMYDFQNSLHISCTEPAEVGIAIFNDFTGGASFDHPAAIMVLASPFSTKGVAYIQANVFLGSWSFGANGFGCFEILQSSILSEDVQTPNPPFIITPFTQLVGIQTVPTTYRLEVMGDIYLDNAGTASKVIFREPSGSGSNITSFEAQTQSGNINYILPPGNATGVLYNTGAGSLTWNTGFVQSLGSAGQIAYFFNPTTITGDANLLYDDSLNQISITGGTTGGLYIDASAGGFDPYVRWTIPSVTDFIAGIDNSDGDKWKISASSALGTSDVLSIFPATQNVGIGTTTDFAGTRLRVIGGITECSSFLGGQSSGNNVLIRSNPFNDGTITFGNSVSGIDSVIVHGTGAGLSIDGSAFETRIVVHDQSATQHFSLVGHKHTNTAATAPTIGLTRTRGTELSPAVLQDGDILGRIIALGFNGTDYSRGAQLHFEVNDGPSTSHMGSSMVFSTTQSGTISLQERMRVTPSGALLIGTTTDVLGTRARVIGGALEASTVYGTTTAGGNLFLRASTGDGLGFVQTKERLQVHTESGIGGGVGGQYTGLTVFPNGVTSAGSSVAAIDVTGTMRWTTQAGFGLGLLFNFASTMRPESTQTQNLGQATLANQPTWLVPASGLKWTINDFNTTIGAANVLTSFPTFSVLGGSSGVMQSAYGASFGGTVNTGWYITDWTPLNIVSPGGSGQITNITAIDIRDFTTRAATQTLSLRSRGVSAEMRHAGIAHIGQDALAQATLHVTQSGVSNEVARFESVVSGAPDDPNYRILQGQVTTTNNTITTLMSLTIASSNSYLIEARIIARRTGGSAGTANDTAAYIIYASVKDVSGTATLVTAGTGGDAAVVASPGKVFENEDNANLAATIDVTGATARVRVTGATNNNYTWHCTLIVQNVSS